MPSGWIVASLAASFFVWPAAAQHAAPPPEKIDVPGGSVTLPMGNSGGRPIVQVKIDGKGPYAFILDTGASITVVDDDLANELGWSSFSGVINAPGAGNVQRLVHIDDLHAGEASLKGVLAALLPLARLFRSDTAPRGVLSAASFPGYLLILDYPARRIVIRNGQLPAADGQSIFEYTPKQILPNIPIHIAGSEVRVHVDTGAPSGLTLPLGYITELPLASEPVTAGDARTPQGEFKVWSAPVKGNIAIGRFKLEVPTVRFGDLNPVPGPPTGNIGYEILKRFVVTLDSRNRRVRFEE